MKRYLVRLGAFGCTMALLTLSNFIWRSPGWVAATVSTFMFMFAMLMAVAILLIILFDFGGPYERN